MGEENDIMLCFLINPPVCLGMLDKLNTYEEETWGKSDVDNTIDETYGNEKNTFIQNQNLMMTIFKPDYAERRLGEFDNLDIWKALSTGENCEEPTCLNW